MTKVKLLKEQRIFSDKEDKHERNKEMVIYEGDKPVSPVRSRFVTVGVAQRDKVKIHVVN